MTALVHEVLGETVKLNGGRPALRVKRGGAWQTLTWSEYQRGCRRVARALISLGVPVGKGVAIIGGNCPEWFMADLGAIFAGAVPAGIYTTNTPAQARYIAAHCEAKVAFADTPAQVDKFVAELDRMPDLEVVVQMHGKPASASRGRLRVLGWDEFLALGDAVPEAELDARQAAQKPDDVCTLIYTSGTTGDPKAVMISHRNIRAMTDSVLPTLGVTRDDVSVSYLPLSHVAEQLLSIHSPMKVGGQLYFAESLEKLPETLQEAHPTVLFGVPRVWEKIQAKMMAAGAAAPPLQKKIAIWARDLGLRASDAEQRGERPPLLYPIAKKLVFDKVRKRLGFDRLRICATGAAPTSRSTHDFFRSLGIPLMEVYGMSECTGAATFSTPAHHRFGKCGRVIPGGEIKIAEDGEICIRGPHVFKGYLKDDEATKNAVDADGYLHSGDIGTIEDGYLQVTDRKKDLLITAGGENIAPQPIEGQLQAIAGVAQAVVVGDRMKYLSALLVLDPERRPAAAGAAGSDAKSVAEAAECQIFRRHIERQINELNQKLARVQTIKKFVVLPSEFSIDSGELTPTMKVKRKVVNTKYERQIASMYSDADAV